MLFVYGTLQDPDILRLVLGRTPDTAAMMPAEAPGYRAVAYPGRVYPALVPAPADRAPGLVISGLTPQDFGRLDAFEGDEYHRRRVVVLAGGQPLVAQTYLPVEKIAGDSLPWSLAGWTALHKQAMLDREAETTRGRVP